VAELLDVGGRAAGALVVVDADEEAAGGARLVDHHHRHAAGHRGAHRRVRVRHAVQAERADHGVAHGHDLLLLAAHAGQQEQLVALGLRRLGEALEEADRAGVGERVGEAFGEHQPDGAAPPGPPPARGWVRPGVAELVRGLQDLPAQRGGELVGAVVGVRDRRA
jgi:hypothetical protein